jgi:hypothetical protein
MIKNITVVPTLAAVLSVAVLALSIGGCGDATTTTSPSGSSTTFTVTPGGYERRQVTGDGSISFSVKGIDMDLDRDKQPIVYFYDSKGYGHGRTTGGFQGELRNYKLKYYHQNGKIASETYHGYRFSSSQTYTVVLEWKTGANGYVRSTVDGKVFEKSGQVADTFTLGIGYPPPGTPGWDGAVYTNIVWPKGSTELK